MQIMELQNLKQRFDIIGNDPALMRALEIAVQVANTDLSVLVTGESGVGKEVIPQIIHQNSARKHGTYIAVNCGAIPEGTIDSELFGHEKGSFTGAYDTRKGYFETANGGTIFLDEVAELPMTTQVRLLRVLQTGEFYKVGSSKVQKTNVRVVAATNKNLPHAIRHGKFREDLYYRLNTVPIVLPALRERVSDINLLFTKFAVDFAQKYQMPPVKLSKGAQMLLAQYRWPGNIRQLKSVAEQMSILEEERLIEPAILQKYLPADGPDSLPVVGGEQNNAEMFSEREKFYMAMLQQLQLEVQNLRMDMERIKGGVPVGINNNEEVAALPAVIPVHPVQSVPAVANVQPVTQPVQPVEPDHELAVEESEAIDVEEYEEDFSIPNATDNLIRKALKKYSNKKEAAEALEISERTLYRKIKELGLED
ncbi:MAG: sigma-54-dependent Fis family transcriptional regulator [Bacteroidales bacterium]|nr:sigma-54-dependent Fis family transcriptional regulator [Bacteroidales bacterium]